MSYFLLYLLVHGLQVIDFLQCMGVLSIIGLFIGWGIWEISIGTGVTTEEAGPTSKWFRSRLLIIICITGFLLLIPDRKEMVAIIAGHYLLNNPIAQQIPEKIIKKIDQYLSNTSEHDKNISEDTIPFIIQGDGK